jgi:hypothetical protein
LEGGDQGLGSGGIDLHVDLSVLAHVAWRRSRGRDLMDLWIYGSMDLEGLLLLERINKERKILPGNRHTSGHSVYRILCRLDGAQYKL